MTEHRTVFPLGRVRRGGHAASLLMAASLGLAACSESPAPEKPVSTGKVAGQEEARPASEAGVKPTGDQESSRFANAVATSKGGAAVDLRYDIATKPVALQPVEVELVFEPRAAADALEVEVSAVPGVTIVNPGQARFAPVANAQPLETRLLVSADADGLYYLNVIVRMVSKVQTEARTFSVPLVVGDEVDVAAGGERPVAPGATAVQPGEPEVKALPAEEGSTAR